jgi:L-threonylcarbamoyladenylate synthase
LIGLKSIKADENGIKKAANVILNGGLVIYPTETVYGLGCLPSDPEASRRVCEVKQRTTKPLPLICSDIQSAKKIVVFDPLSETLAEKFWPGPLTLILPNKVNYSKWVNREKKTLGVRVPNSEVARKLAELSGGVIVSTSSNLSGEDPHVTAQEAEMHLGRNVDLILDGGTLSGQLPSTILDLSGAYLKILRRGPITEEEIIKVLKLQSFQPFGTRNATF